MTTSTLVDAARGLLVRLEWPADDPQVSALRAAIDREAERQEIIDGLVEAARETDGLPWPDMAQAWSDSDMDEYNRAMHAFAQMSTALARYDAMKEDDRG